MKELWEISWQVTEPEYRKDSALSQSTLAKYEREGFSKLGTLFEHVSTPSLTFGSVVDELMTGDSVSFEKRFLVAEFPKLKPAHEVAVNALADKYKETYKTITDIPDDDIINTLDECGFYSHYSRNKRIDLITEPGCCDYYKLLRSANGKEVISQEVYTDAVNCAASLHSSNATGVYFGNDTDKIKRYYQLKFKDVIDGIEYRGMLDLILVDYERKIVVPCDLKTTSSMEYEFGDSFFKWRYDIQARLYWRLLRDAMDRDEYFKDFELKNFRFICVNRNTKNPLVWEFPDTQSTEDIYLGYRTLRTPWAIGKELDHYLKTNPTVPEGIKTVGLNDISAYLNNKYGTRNHQPETDQAG